LLPLSVLYKFSKIFYFFLYYFPSYRKDISYENIKRSFPHYSHQQILEIQKKFYRYLSILFIEIIKSISISPHDLQKRIIVENPEVLQQLYSQKKSIIAITGHYLNWEWAALSLNFHSPHQAYGVYKQLSNPKVDRWLQKHRSKFGMKLIEMKKVFSFFRNNRQPSLIGFIADQWPSAPHKAVWVHFLNQETPFFKGPELFSKKFENYVVLYGKVNMQKKGVYQIKYEIVSLSPKKEQNEEITKKWVKLLENQILESPEYWLWTHKRWKKSYEEVFQNQQ
jgi:KDO2-lipid IV(A) lauroyltransferase